MRALTRFGLSLLPLALLACKTEPGTVVDTDTDVDVDDDIDNDGSPFGEDCDDEDPLRFPNPGGYGDGAEITRVDVPYNHIDDDCGGADGDTTDLVDVDGDGYAGVSFEAYAAEHLALTGLTSVDDVPWTADRVSVDCLDQDGLIILPAPLTAADVNPSATTDPPYDGVDQDCAGDNDFDADGDGFHPTEYASSFADFVNAFHPDTSPFGPASWAPPGGLRAEDGDCLDQPHPALPALAPDTVYPGAVDAPYDGIDANCDGSNDFDADGDGTIATDDLLAFSEYVANWTGTAPGFPNTVTQTFAVGGDCDDTNPTVPASELLFDADDSDCDAHVDATPFAFSAYAWHTPTWPRVVRTDAHYVIGTTALWGDLRIVQQEHVAPALLFAPDSAYQAPVVDVVLWNNVSAGSVFEHGAGVDMVGRPEAFWVSASYFSRSR
jgi:hypothetical protein